VEVKMKIGIVIHSNTGNTYSVAEKLRDKLVTNGHSVEMRKIVPVDGENINESDITKITFNPQPNVTGFDELIICAPVRGFSISPVLAAYLSKINSLKGLKVDLFVTQYLPFTWMGGNRAISQMKSTCETKGAIVGKTGIINWKSKKKNYMISDVVERFSIRFK
jgi:hypothetical protein